MKEIARIQFCDIAQVIFVENDDKTIDIATVLASQIKLTQLESTQCATLSDAIVTCYETLANLIDALPERTGTYTVSAINEGINPAPGTLH